MNLPASLTHFERVFSQSADPWQTKSSFAELHKCKTILALLGARKHGRILELGCGNGSNSVYLSAWSLNLDACDGAVHALARAQKTLGDVSNATLYHLPLPARFPGRSYDTIVIAELLYYLDNRTLEAVMREIDRTLRPGGLLILCHHHQQFEDAAQRQAGLHKRFISLSQRQWHVERAHRTARWMAQSLRS